MKIKELIIELLKYNQEKEVHFCKESLSNKNNSYVHIDNVATKINGKWIEYITIRETVQKKPEFKIGQIFKFEGEIGKISSISYIYGTGEPLYCLECVDNCEYSVTISEAKLKTKGEEIIESLKDKE